MEETANQKKIVNILPLKKGRRVLLFLADFFLNFILAFILFFLASFPIGKAITGYNIKNNLYTENLSNRGQVLLRNEILIQCPDYEDYDISSNVNFTSDCFLSYYALDEESPTNVKYSQFGHKTINQVFHKYFLTILGDEAKFISLFDHYNAKYAYFDRNGTDISLKAEIKEQVAPHFYKNETVSSLGKKYVSNIKNSLYYPMYSEIMDSIKKNDLTFGDYSYNELQRDIKGFETYIYNLVQYTSIITGVISTALLYVLIPLINRSHKTIGMMILKIERVNLKSLNYIKKGEVILNAVYQLFYIFIICFFIPMTSLSFVEMFKIQLLFILGIFSILMMMANLIYLLFDKFNRSMFDRLLQMVHLTTSELDDVYRARGYYL